MKRDLTFVDPDIQHLEEVIYAKDQPQYLPLPTRRNRSGDVVVRVKPSFWSRVCIMFGADFYLTMLTFNKPLTPIRVSLEKPEEMHY